ncbi:MAG TPA: chemotaxis-specific protein-glutamate methyltransferase CheB [Leptolyngbyaceae cyanobacterium]
MTNSRSQGPIRVLLVEDSPIAIAILKRILSSSPEIEIVGTARTGVEALTLIPKVKPDVVCTDLHMPQMSGLELTRHIMAEFPCPILVISASVQENNPTNVFQLLEAGAVDVFPKPRSGLPEDYERTKQALINKIRVLSGVKVFTQHRRANSSVMATPLKPGSTQAVYTPAPPAPILSAPSPRNPDIRAPRIIAVGASTGGPNALHTLLRVLPPTLPVPVLCVQHISEGFLQGLVDWLRRECHLNIAVAQTGQLPQAGTVYFAPENQHLELDGSGRLLCTTAAPVSGHCPSATVLFKSVAAYYRRSVVAALLTGMGRDGAEGLLTVAQAGGVTIAQDEATSVVFGMPKEAIALGAAQYVLPIQKIGVQIGSIFTNTGA